MDKKKRLIKQIQMGLNDLDFNCGVADGLVGKLSINALKRANDHFDFHDKYDNGNVFDKKLRNFIYNEINIRDEGEFEDITEEDYKKLLETKNKQDLQNKNIPSQSEVRALTSIYGTYGESNIINIESPYSLRLSWDTTKRTTKIRCHKEVAESLSNILDEVLDHYGKNKIEELGLNLYGGCYYLRAIRGGTKLSTHSWGIAIDWDTANNKLRQTDTKYKNRKGEIIKPARFTTSSEYDKFLDIHEKHGWISLGRKKNYDYMHFQRALYK